MTTRGRIARIMVAGAAVLALATGGLVTSGAAFAAADAVTITPATTTTASGTVVTYTLGITCSTSPSCGDSTVTIPTGAVTGDGATTDFGGWFTTPRTCPAPTISGGQASFAFPNLTNGSQSCTFSLRAPNKTTLNGASATIAPTITTAGGSTPAATPATLTLTAGHTDSMGASINGGTNPSVFSGGPVTLTYAFNCGVNTGDLALSALRITNVLPADFTFTGLTTAPIATNLQGTITTPAAGATGGTISYVGNGHDCDNPAYNRITFTVTGTATADGVADPVGAQICQSGVTSSFTYIDGFAMTATPATTPCATVVDINYTSTKGVDAGTFGNSGQYKASDGTQPARYTFPGDWDRSGGDTTFNVNASTMPAIANAGLSYTIQDPLPCLDNLTGVTYGSNAPGTPCAHPAYIAKKVTAAGFTPAAGSLIDLIFADGTTGTAAYVAGNGWTLPASPAVSEIDFRPYVEEGANSAAVITFTMSGYVAANATPGRIVTNTAAFSAVFSGTTNAVKTPQARGTSILIADATAGDHSGTVIYPNLVGAQIGTTCAEQVSFNTSATQRSRIEIAQAPSQAIYIDYLSPVGAGTITADQTFTLQGTDNGRTFTSGSLAPTVTADYNGTGRTLLRWVIPAGLATVPGQYNLNGTNFTVPLSAGCAGTYHNAVTVGYGAPSVTPDALVNACVSTQQSGAQQAPFNPPTDSGLTTNSTPVAGNYCGFNSTFAIAAILPKFTVGKSVQGDMDSAPVGAGGTGKVAPSGGSAQYTVTFSNSGQANLHDPVMYDLLPRVGDTEASSATPRGSTFTPTLAAAVVPPAGVTVSYSTAANPCRPEVFSGNPGCTDDWTTTVPPLATVTALRFFYSGTIGVAASTQFPVHGFSVSYSVTTPATTPGNTAWNTVGTNAHVGDTGDPSVTNDFVSPIGAESPRTGITASSSVPTIVKTASTPTFDAAGQSITFTFRVTNNGSVALSNVTVTDAFTDAAAGSTPPTVTGPSSIAVGATETYTATYAVTQADLDHGLITDVATASGTSPAGGSISNTSDAVTVTATAVAGLTLSKTASVSAVAAVGDPITYGFAVRNTGNQTVHGLTIDDPMLADVTCPATSLAPDESTECTASYATTQADLDAGAISNTATASAVSPADDPVTSPASTADVTATQAPALSLTKSASPTVVGAVGDVVTFSFLVTNTGNVTLGTVGITDSMLPSTTCPTPTLAPADTETCTGSYTVTQADLDSGSIVNTATAHGTTTSPTPRTVDSASSSAAVTATQSAVLQLTETASLAQATAAGQTIVFSFHVVNAGNVTVTGIAVTQTGFTGRGTAPTVSCPGTSLAPGDDMTCTATYVTVEADLALASIDDPSTVTGVTAAGSMAPITANATVPVDAPADPGPPVGAVGAGLLAATGVAGIGYGVVSAMAMLTLGLVLLLRRRRHREP